MNKKGIITILTSIIFIGITVLFYSNFSLYTDYNFSSNYYKIDNNYIYNISSYTTKDLYKKYFDVTNYELKIENSNDYISNGSKLIVLDKNDKLVSTLTNIVKGDIVSNGIVDNEDVKKFEDYLLNKYQLEEYESKCLDINDDNDITIEDLDLLKTALNEGIKSIAIKENNIEILENEQYRLIVSVSPNYGINTNLKWESSNDAIVTVDESGLLTPHKVGTTIIKVTDISNKMSKEVKVTVDNTIKLSNNEGTSFVSDQELMINIRAIDYKDIECKSSNSEISTCRIDNNILYISALARGNSVITVTSPKYGETTYNLTSYSNYLDFIPEYYCMPANKRDILNLEYEYNNLTITNNKFTTNTYIKNNQFYIQSMNTAGREELVITDNNNNTSKMIIDVYNLNIPSVGAFIKKGTETSANITMQNTSELKCTSPNTSIADCYIKDNKLYVKGNSKGEVTLKITNTNTYNNKEYDCGETSFLAVITE